MKFLFDDSNQNVSRHGAPDLRLDGVLAVAQKLLDAKVLFDPFEEQHYINQYLKLMKLLPLNRGRRLA